MGVVQLVQQKMGGHVLQEALSLRVNELTIVEIAKR